MWGNRAATVASSWPPFIPGILKSVMRTSTALPSSFASASEPLQASTVSNPRRLSRRFSARSTSGSSSTRRTRIFPVIQVETAARGFG